VNLEWIKVDGGNIFSGYETLILPQVEITLESRPHYCDRGNFIAKVSIKTGYKFDKGCWVDDQDGWPRYYFDEARAKAEIEAWLKKRGLIP
jgi:hypothetical protein